MHSHPFLKLKISTLFVTYYFTKKTPHRQGNREKTKEKKEKSDLLSQVALSVVAQKDLLFRRCRQGEICF